MVDKVALAKTGLKFAAGKKSKNSKNEKAKTPKPGDNPFYYLEVAHDRYGQPKLDSKGRPVTKEHRKDREYYVYKLGIPEEDAKILLKMKKRAMLMDGGRKVMGFRIPLGLSTVLTFCVPEIGDGVDGLISYVMVVRAGKISGGLGARNHAAMTLNVGRDFAIGAIPFAGAIIDMFYRANTRNSNMLEKILIERVKKAQLHPDASYESSLHDSTSDGHSIHSARTAIPQTKAKRNERALEEPTPARRSNTQGSNKVHDQRNARRFEDFVGPESTVTPKVKDQGSKKVSSGSRAQNRYEQSRTQNFAPDRSEESAAPQSRRFISARDL